MCIKITKEKTMRIIYADGCIEDYKPKGKRVTLEEMQKVVGGYIEIVSLASEKKRMVVNEEGAIIPLKPNFIATMIYRKETGSTSVIYGDALLTDWNDID